MISGYRYRCSTNGFIGLWVDGSDSITGPRYQSQTWLTVALWESLEKMDHLGLCLLLIRISTIAMSSSTTISPALFIEREIISLVPYILLVFLGELTLAFLKDKHPFFYIKQNLWDIFAISFGSIYPISAISTFFFI